MPSLVPGAIHGGTLTLTVPTSVPLGTYYVIACADDTKVVAELDETNNGKASVGTVQVALTQPVSDECLDRASHVQHGKTVSVSDSIRRLSGFIAFLRVRLCAHERSPYDRSLPRPKRKRSVCRMDRYWVNSIGHRNASGGSVATTAGAFRVEWRPPGEGVALQAVKIDGTEGIGPTLAAISRNRPEA